MINMRNAKWSTDFSPVDPNGHCFVDTQYSRAYLHHLFKAKELLAMQIASIHNLAFYLWLVREARQQILADNFASWKKEWWNACHGACDFSTDAVRVFYKLA